MLIAELLGGRQVGSGIKLIGKLIIHTNPGKPGDDDRTTEGNFSKIIIDHIIPIKSPLQQPSVQIDPLGVSHHDDKSLSIGSSQFIGALYTLLRLNHRRSKLTLGQRP